MTGIINSLKFAGFYQTTNNFCYNQMRFMKEIKENCHNVKLYFCEAIEKKIMCSLRLVLMQVGKSLLRTGSGEGCEGTQAHPYSDVI